MKVTLDDLYNITKSVDRDVLIPFVAPLNAGFSRFNFNTPLRVAHFLAQVVLESGEFQYTRELWGPTPVQETYETRGDGDLGNTQPGDGKLFMGRGLIQTTGRANYQSLSDETGIDYVSNPERLERLPDCVDSAFYFWNRNGLSELADADDVRAITRRVNGGESHLLERTEYLTRAKTWLKIQ